MDVAYWSVCVVLIGSGVGKVIAPQPFEAATAELGLPAFSGLGRLVGALETALGLLGLLSASAAVAVGVGLLFVVFSVVVVAAMSAGLEDCGCIGVTRSRPSWPHVLVNAVAAVLSFATAAVGPVAIGSGLAAVSWPIALAAGAGVALLAGVILTVLATGSS